MQDLHSVFQLYKNVAERGRWSEMLMEAHNTYRNGLVDQAALKYLFLSELGYEVAQSNIAYILDRGMQSCKLVSSLLLDPDAPTFDLSIGVV